MDLKRLREQRGKLLQEWRELLDAAEKEDRDFNETEQARYDEIAAELEKIKPRIERLEAFDAASREAAGAIGHLPADHRIVNPGERETADEYRDLHLGGRLRAFPNDHEGRRSAYRAGQWLAGYIFGNEASRQWCERNLEQRILAGSINALGGFLVPDEYSRRIIDLVEEFGVFRREANVVPMSSDTLIIPRRAGGVTATFTAENAALTESDPNWDAVQLTARKLAVITRYSTELAEDAIVSMADRLAVEFARAFALREDEVGFTGNGAAADGSITGVNNALAAGSVNAGVPNTFGTAVIADFYGIVGMLPMFPGIMPKWYISNPGWTHSMMRLAFATGAQSIAEWIAGVPKYAFLGYPVVISQVLRQALGAAATGDTMYLFGDLQMAATMGVRRQITLAVSDERYFENDQLAIRATERFDINVHERGTAAAAGPILSAESV